MSKDNDMRNRCCICFKRKQLELIILFCNWRWLFRPRCHLPLHSSTNITDSKSSEEFFNDFFLSCRSSFDSGSGWEIFPGGTQQQDQIYLY